MHGCTSITATARRTGPERAGWRGDRQGGQDVQIEGLRWRGGQAGQVARGKRSKGLARDERKGMSRLDRHVAHVLLSYAALLATN